MQRIGIKILPDFLERMISRHQLVAVGKIDTIHARIHMWRTAHQDRSEEHTSELQSQSNLVCRLLLEKKKQNRAPDLVGKAPSNAERSPRIVHARRLRFYRDQPPRGHIGGSAGCTPLPVKSRIPYSH